MAAHGEWFAQSNQKAQENMEDDKKKYDKEYSLNEKILILLFIIFSIFCTYCR